MSVLFVLSSHDQLGDTGRKTGTWLEELVAPYYEFVGQGLNVEFASPAGGAAPIDPASIEAYREDPLYKRYTEDAGLHQKLASTRKLAEVSPGDYDGVVYPGGHGPLFDLRTDRASQLLISTMLDQGKPVGVVCHAGCVLIDIKTDEGAPLVRDRDVTGFTDAEEAAVSLTDRVPYSVEQELKALGSRYVSVENWAPNVRVDGTLITGQNPASARPLATEMLRFLMQAGGSQGNREAGAVV